MHTYACVCAGGRCWGAWPGTLARSGELWVLQRLEQDYDLARGRSGLFRECSGCQPLPWWAKSHLHLALKSPGLLGSGNRAAVTASADFLCKMAHAAASIKKVREAELDEKEKNLERERKKQRKIPRERMERKRKV